MTSDRLETFSDGVLAIVITIMVLEFNTPEEVSLEAVVSMLPVFTSYLLSFIYIGLYWINHHHLFQITEKITGNILWLNLHLLFWLSLIPFATSWMGEHHLASAPLALYGFILFMGGLAYEILQKAIINNHDKDFVLNQIVNGFVKAKLPFVIYLLGITLSYLIPWVSMACYVTVALLWIIHNNQIEENIA